MRRSAAASIRCRFISRSSTAGAVSAVEVAAASSSNSCMAAAKTRPPLRSTAFGCVELAEPSDNFRDETVCPITNLRMTTPVVASDGHTYEEAAIRKVIDTTGISPMTREKLETTVFRIFSMQSIIQEKNVRAEKRQRTT